MASSPALRSSGVREEGSTSPSVLNQTNASTRAKGARPPSARDDLRQSSGIDVTVSDVASKVPTLDDQAMASLLLADQQLQALRVSDEIPAGSESWLPSNASSPSSEFPRVQLPSRGAAIGQQELGIMLKQQQGQQQQGQQQGQQQQGQQQKLVMAQAQAQLGGISSASPNAQSCGSFLDGNGLGGMYLMDLGAESGRTVQSGFKNGNSSPSRSAQDTDWNELVSSGSSAAMPGLNTSGQYQGGLQQVLYASDGSPMSVGGAQHQMMQPATGQHQQLMQMQQYLQQQQQQLMQMKQMNHRLLTQNTNFPQQAGQQLHVQQSGRQQQLQQSQHQTQQAQQQQAQQQQAHQQQAQPTQQQKLLLQKQKQQQQQQQHLLLQQQQQQQQQQQISHAKAQVNRTKFGASSQYQPGLLLDNDMRGNYLLDISESAKHEQSMHALASMSEYLSAPTIPVHGMDDKYSSLGSDSKYASTASASGQSLSMLQPNGMFADSLLLQQHSQQDIHEQQLELQRQMQQGLFLSVQPTMYSNEALQRMQDLTGTRQAIYQQPGMQFPGQQQLNMRMEPNPGVRMSAISNQGIPRYSVGMSQSEYLDLNQHQRGMQREHQGSAQFLHSSATELGKQDASYLVHPSWEHGSTTGGMTDSSNMLYSSAGPIIMPTGLEEGALSMPARFSILTPAIARKVLDITRVTSAIRLQDFDVKVLSKMAFLCDRYGEAECVDMLDKLSGRIRMKNTVMKNGAGYIDVAVSSYLDILMAATSTVPVIAKSVDYAKEHLSPAVYEELAKTIRITPMLQWFHFDQGVIHLLRMLAEPQAIMKLKDIAGRPYHGVQNITGFVTRILSSSA